MTPPMRTEETVIFCSCHGPMDLRQAAGKNGPRARRMPVTGDKENAGRVERLKTPGNKAGFSQRGVFFKRAYTDLCRHLFGVLLKERIRVFSGCMAEVAGVRRCVKK